MRFLKITDTDFGKDIIHVWIEDDCPDEAVAEIISSMSLIVDGHSTHYKFTDRQYERKL